MCLTEGMLYLSSGAWAIVCTHCNWDQDVETADLQGEEAAGSESEREVREGRGPTFVSELQCILTLEARSSPYVPFLWI